MTVFVPNCNSVCCFFLHRKNRRATRAGRREERKPNEQSESVRSVMDRAKFHSTDVSIDEVLWNVAREQLSAYEPANRAARNTPLLRSLVPATVTVVLPQGSVRTVMIDDEGLRRLAPAQVASATTNGGADLQIMMEQIRDLVLQAFYASIRYEHVLTAKAKVGESLRTLIRYKPSHSPTVTQKPNYEELYRKGQIPYIVDNLPNFCWGCIAAFLPMRDLLALPQVGSVFYMERNEIVWKSIYSRCFGEFSPKELRLVNPWDDFDVTEFESEPPQTASVVDAEGGGWVLPSVDYHRNLRITLTPFLSAPKPNYRLKPSPEDFLQNIAPKGSILLGNTRFLITNMSPLHFISIPAGKAEVIMEEVITCLGSVYFLTVAVSMARGHPLAANVVASPTMRRELASSATRFVLQQQRQF